MRRSLAVVLMLLASGAQAQEWITVPPSRRTTPEAGSAGQGTAPPVAGTAATAPGGAVRVLDKINGTLLDLDLRTGESAEIGGVSVTMGECRYPADNPAGDAFALVSIRTLRDDTAVFEGWLIASAPALNALDHPRYDVWALRCTGLSLPTPEPEPNAP